MSIKAFIQAGVKAPHVWPVAILAFGLGPLLAAYHSYHLISGPDCRVLKNFSTNDQYAQKQFKYIASFDHATYEHPRPKF